jgi:hypothetical protein
MPKRQSSCRECDVPSQESKNRENDAWFQARKLISQCIEEATLVFRKQLADYYRLQNALDAKFHELGPLSSNAKLIDLLVVVEMHAQASDSATKIVWALERLARLSYGIEQEAGSVERAAVR